MNALKVLLIFSVIVSLGTGCASSRKAAWEKSDEAITLTAGEKAKLMEEGKKLWLTRNVKADLEKALEKFERVANSDAYHLESFIYLTRGYYLMADGILEDMDEKKKNWEISVSWGEKGMATNAAFKKAVTEENKSVAEAVPLLQKDQVEPLYWAAASLGKWAKNSGIMTTLQYKSQIQAMIERVGQLAPNYFYGAVPRYWGVYYAVAPGFAGGSMEKSYENFQKAFKLNNNYLGTHVLYAENYAARKGDKTTFKKELTFVINAKPDVIPELTPEHTLEKVRAKRMLDNMEEYF